jgi:hypothetical protein
VGGVDFNVDINFTIDGRSYKKGKQHMNGQAVLDYCRVRKGRISARPGDLNRVNRQKDMLLAVFAKLQKEATILGVPKIVSGMQGKVYTNMNFAQLAALAVFGSKLPAKNITMHTFPGSYADVFNFGYLLLDPDKRASIIKKVYGVKVAPMYRYTPSFARFQWAYMQGKAWVSVINATIAKDAKLGAGKQKLIDAEANAKLAESVAATQKLLTQYKSKYNSSRPSVTREQYEALDKQVQAMYDLAVSVLGTAGYKPNWHVAVYRRGQLAMHE